MTAAAVKLSKKQEQIAIDAVDALPPTVFESRIPAGTVAEALDVTEDHGASILADLLKRNLIELRLEHPANNIAETGQVVVNCRFKYFAVKDR